MSVFHLKWNRHLQAFCPLSLWFLHVITLWLSQMIPLWLLHNVIPLWLLHVIPLWLLQIISLWLLHNAIPLWLLRMIPLWLAATSGLMRSACTPPLHCVPCPAQSPMLQTGRAPAFATSLRANLHALDPSCGCGGRDDAKKLIASWFPGGIFDTKHLAGLMPEEMQLHDTSLGQLFANLTLPGSPQVQTADFFERVCLCAHCAGTRASVRMELRAVSIFLRVCEVCAVSTESMHMGSSPVLR